MQVEDEYEASEVFDYEVYTDEPNVNHEHTTQVEGVDEVSDVSDDEVNRDEPNVNHVHTTQVEGVAPPPIVTELKDQVGKLQTQVGELNKTNENVAENQKKTIDQVGELQPQIGELQTQIGELKTQIGELIKKFEDQSEAANNAAPQEPLNVVVIDHWKQFKPSGRGRAEKTITLTRNNHRFTLHLKRRPWPNNNKVDFYLHGPWIEDNRPIRSKRDLEKLWARRKNSLQ